VDQGSIIIVKYKHEKLDFDNNEVNKVWNEYFERLLIE